MRSFLQDLASIGCTSFEDLPPDILMQYTTKLSALGLQPATFNLYVAAVKKYFKWVRQCGVAVGTIHSPDLPKNQPKIREILPLELFSQYFQEADQHKEPWRTALMLMPCVGLRISELITLQLDSITKTPIQMQDKTTRNAMALRVVGKGGTAKIVPVIFDGEQLLISYLAEYRRDQKGKWLFPVPKKPSQHISDNTLRHKLIELRQPLGIDDITPHTLRRTYIVTLHRRGVDIATIAKIAGHRNVSTTLQHYLNLDAHDVVSAVYRNA